MFMIFIIFLSMFFLSNLIMLITMIMMKKMSSYQEKLSPFECGFNPISSSRLPFSIHFFFITIIFLIFDIEIALILPMIFIFKMNNMFIWTLMYTYFLIILLLGIFFEWNQMMIEWTN